MTELLNRFKEPSSYAGLTQIARYGWRTNGSGFATYCRWIGCNLGILSVFSVRRHGGACLYHCLRRGPRRDTLRRLQVGRVSRQVKRRLFTAAAENQ